jgi:hypothetical protein
MRRLMIVSWEFLFKILKSRGFSSMWVNWIDKVVKQGSVGVMPNGEESSFLKTGKGLRQVEPMSPLLFNLVGDVLTRMLTKGDNSGPIKGLGADFSMRGNIFTVC